MAGVDAIRFWQLTPAELSVEIEAWNKQQELEDFRVGLICAVIAEPYRDAKKQKQPFTPQDFMPTRGGKEAERPQRQDWREQLSIIERLNKAFGGDDLRR